MYPDSGINDKESSTILGLRVYVEIRNLEVFDEIKLSVNGKTETLRRTKNPVPLNKKNKNWN